MQNDTENIARLIRKELLLEIEHVRRQSSERFHRPVLDALEKRPLADEAFLDWSTQRHRSRELGCVIRLVDAGCSLGIRWFHRAVRSKLLLLLLLLIERCR